MSRSTRAGALLTMATLAAPPGCFLVTDFADYAPEDQPGAGGSGPVGGGSASGNGGSSGSGSAAGGAGGAGGQLPLDCAAIVPDPSPGYGAEVLADAPLAYWRLDDPKGSADASDATPNGQTATIYNPSGVTLQWPGLLPGNGAYYLDGGAHIFTENVDLADAPFTVEAWVYPDIVDGTYRRVADQTVYRPRFGHTLVLWQQGVSFERWVDDGLAGVAATSTPVAKGEFTHLVGRYDGRTVTLFVNGLPVGGEPATGSVLAAAPLAFGQTSDNASGMIGVLDEVAVYDVGLTEERIAIHYCNGKQGYR